MKNAIDFQKGVLDMEKTRSWGGARAGAGRKASPVPKKQRNLRLTAEEYAVVKEALKRHRMGIQEPTEAPVEVPAAPVQVTYNEDDSAALLGHVLHLQDQYIHWQDEYCKWIKNSSYDKYDPEYMKLMMQILSAQLLTLQPHLLGVSYAIEASSDYNKRQQAGLYLSAVHPTLPDIQLKAWKAPAEAIDYDTTNLHVSKNHKLIRQNREKIKKLEREYDV